MYPFFASFLGYIQIVRRGGGWRAEPSPCCKLLLIITWYIIWRVGWVLNEKEESEYRIPTACRYYNAVLQRVFVFLRKCDGSKSVDTSGLLESLSETKRKQQDAESFWWPHAREKGHLSIPQQCLKYLKKIGVSTSGVLGTAVEVLLLPLKRTVESLKAYVEVRSKSEVSRSRSSGPRFRRKEASIAPFHTKQKVHRQPLMCHNYMRWSWEQTRPVKDAVRGLDIKCFSRLRGVVPGPHFVLVDKLMWTNN